MNHRIDQGPITRHEVVDARGRAAAVGESGLEVDLLVAEPAERIPRSPLAQLEQQNREMSCALRAMEARQVELELADERKNQFIATLAHELRNPLATLQMTVHILRHEPQYQARGLVAHLDVVSAQSQRLAQLVADLTDVARASQDKLELHKRPTDINELVSQALEVTRAAMEMKEHRVTLTLAPQPLWVEVDTTRLKQALTNVLHNAARYSPQHGRIMVGVRREASRVVVEVADSGMGIPADLLPHVFDLFVQGSHPTEGGLGVGLALARRLVHDHGGTIAAASAGHGLGSQFTVTLPLCAGPR